MRRTEEAIKDARTLEEAEEAIRQIATTTLYTNKNQRERDDRKKGRSQPY